MIKIGIISLLLVLTGNNLALGFDPSSNAGHEGHNHDSEGIYYTCSMHPEVRQSKPGKCSICNMNLTKVVMEEDDDEDSEQESHKHHSQVSESSEDAIAKVKLRKSQLSHFRPSYFPVTPMRMSKEVRLLGSVLQSEDRESAIPARISGRVEKNYIRSTGSFIQKETRSSSSTALNSSQQVKSISFPENHSRRIAPLNWKA